MRGSAVAARMFGAGVDVRVVIVVTEIPGRAGFDREVAAATDLDAGGDRDREVLAGELVTW